MGRSETRVVETRETQTQPEPLPEQREQIQLQLERQRAAQPGVLDLDQALLDQIVGLARGEKLTGQFETLGQGIPEEVQQDIIQRSLEDVRPGLERVGLLDSGVRAEVEADISRDLRTQSALEQVRQRENLLNLLQGLPLTVNKPLLQSNATLAQQLAALTPVITRGTGRQTQDNPFITGRDIGRAAGVGIGILCWVASEVFGGWFEPKTCRARNFMGTRAPLWLRNAYIKHGPAVARFISGKPILKAMLRPIFEVFALLGGR